MIWPYALLVLLASYYLIDYLYVLYLSRKFGAKPAPPLDSGYFNINSLRETYKALQDGSILELMNSRFATGTGTVSARNIVQGKSTLTIDPANLKAILVSQYHEFGQAGKVRIFSQLKTKGIFWSEGARWKHLRSVLRPSFTRDEVTRVEYLEDHVKNLITRIKEHKENRFDIQELFFRLTLDMICEIMAGQAPGLLSPEGASDEAEKVGYAMDYLTEHFSKISMGQSKWFLNNFKFKQLEQVLDDFLDKPIERVLSLSNEERSKALEKRFILLYSLADLERDKTEMRSQLSNILLAGRDTTAQTLTWAVFELARHPDVWRKLQGEVAGNIGMDPSVPLSFKDLTSLTYLSHVIDETLRLYPQPPLNSRTAKKNTVLPRGGGPHGDDPVLIREGEALYFSTHSLHRLTEVYGQDANEFRPERWGEGLQPGWAYLPFNAGPRVCIGRQLALNEISFVLVRLVQNFSQVELSEEPDYPPGIRLRITSMKRKGLYVSFRV